MSRAIAEPGASVTNPPSSRKRAFSHAARGFQQPVNRVLDDRVKIAVVDPLGLISCHGSPNNPLVVIENPQPAG